MGKWHTAAGALHMIAWLVMLDGAILAKDKWGDAYNFVDTLPGLFGTFGLMLFAICKIRAIAQISGDDDGYNMMGGGGGGMYGDDSDDNTSMKARIVFFIAATFMLAALTVGVWQVAGPRATHPWAAWAMIIQSFINIAAAFALGVGQVQNDTPQDDNPFS